MLEELKRRPAIRARVFERDGGCLAQHVLGLGPCFGVLTAHHILKASQGGKYEDGNLLTMCAHHNELFESDADAARIAEQCGFVQRRNSLPQEPESGCGGSPPPSRPAVSDARHGSRDLLGEFIANNRDDIASGEVWPDEREAESD